MNLAFVGYGALGRQIETIVTQVSQAKSVVYFDDQAHRAGMPGAHPFAAHVDAEFTAYRFYVCLGYKHLALKAQLVQRLLELGRAVPSVVHPSAYVDPTARLGDGASVYPGCTVDQRVVIGRGTLLNAGVVVAHDTAIGDACWLGPGVTLSGDVRVGSGCFLGSGSTVSNHIEIGADAVVGLATAVTKHVAAGTSVIGNPMRVLSRKLNLL